jgi:hypothetical protein
MNVGPALFLGRTAICALGRTADAPSLSRKPASAAALVHSQEAPRPEGYVRDVEGSFVRLAARRFYTNRDGKLLRQPVLLSIIGMREALLQASDFDEAKVNLICKNVEH